MKPRRFGAYSVALGALVLASSLFTGIGGAEAATSGPSVASAQAGSLAVAANTCSGSVGSYFYVTGTSRSGALPNDAGRNKNCIMRQGTAGASVYALQSALNTCHGAGLTIDGQYGPATAAAVRARQAAGGITQDGIYGPQTLTKIRFWATFNNGTGGVCYWGSSFDASGWPPGP